jgi:asparaginyl-tRNA synthetase
MPFISFQGQPFGYIHTPIITGSDAEGAKCLRRNIGHENPPTKPDGTMTTKTLKRNQPDRQWTAEAEIFALAFRNVYTFGPTFAENSNTARLRVLDD